MRQMLGELRKELGMPLEHDRDADADDYGYRSTLSMKDLENPDLRNDINVPADRAASPRWSADRLSPPRPNSYVGGVGRPPLPGRHGRGRSDNLVTGFSQDSVEIHVRDNSPRQVVNVLTIEDRFENTNCSNYNQSTLVGSDDGFDELDAAPSRGQVTPSSIRSVKSPTPSDRPDSSSSARRRLGEYRRDDSTRLSTEEPLIDLPNAAGLIHDDLPRPSDQSHFGLDRTRTIELAGSLENGGIRRSRSVSYRDSEREDGTTERVDRRGEYDDNDDDLDSYGAYDTNDQLLDTLSEYQHKLEKTNFVDEADDDSLEDPITAPVPLPRRQTAADKPESSSPPGPDSPSDSIDVSELEDEYLE